MHEGDGMGAGPAERATHAGGDGPAPRRRMSARRKQDAVPRLPRGEDLELVSRGLGLAVALKAHTRSAHNLTKVLSATDHTPGDLTGVPCGTGYCHLGGKAVPDDEAYGAGIVETP